MCVTLLSSGGAIALRHKHPRSSKRSVSLRCAESSSFVIQTRMVSWTALNLMNSKCVKMSPCFCAETNHPQEKVLQSASTNARARGYQRDGLGTHCGRCEKWRPDRGRLPVPTYLFHSIRTARNDVDCAKNIRIWRRSETHRGVPVPEVCPRTASSRSCFTYYSRFDVPHDCTVELSPLGVKFLTEIFNAYDKVIRYKISSLSYAQRCSLGPRWRSEPNRIARSFQHISRQSMGQKQVPRHNRL